MSYDPQCADKILPRGNSRAFRLTVREPKTGSNQTPAGINLDGALIVFEMKRQPELWPLQPTDDVVVRKTSDDAAEIEILTQSGETLGQVLIKLLPADTKFLDPGTYAYSVDVITALGNQYTVANGRIFLRGPATAAENTTPP